MQHSNSISLRVWGRYALFSDPITRVGGEKFSYPIPTYQAVKGILESVYWKPTFLWVPDAIRIMNPIETESKGIRPIRYHKDANDLSIYTYLVHVSYQVKAALARRAQGNSGRILSTIAADERRHAKRLSTAYFLLSGVRYWPIDRKMNPTPAPFAASLRERFMAEQRGAAAYQAAAAETADPCLRQLYEELAGEEDAHAWLIRGILEEL